MSAFKRCKAICIYLWNVGLWSPLLEKIIMLQKPVIFLSVKRRIYSLLFLMHFDIIHIWHFWFWHLSIYRYVEDQKFRFEFDFKSFKKARRLFFSVFKLCFSYLKRTQKNWEVVIAASYPIVHCSECISFISKYNAFVLLSYYLLAKTGTTKIYLFFQRSKGFY